MMTQYHNLNIHSNEELAEYRHEMKEKNPSDLDERYFTKTTQNQTDLNEHLPQSLTNIILEYDDQIKLETMIVKEKLNLQIFKGMTIYDVDDINIFKAYQNESKIYFFVPHNRYEVNQGILQFKILDLRCSLEYIKGRLLIKDNAHDRHCEEELQNELDDEIQSYEDAYILNEEEGDEDDEDEDDDDEGDEDDDEGDEDDDDDEGDEDDDEEDEDEN
jgi:hypothetical protein